MSTWLRFPRRLRSRRAAVASAIAIVAAFSALSAWLFVFPSTGMPARADAIVVLGGSGNRLDLGYELAHEDKAPYLVLSLGLPWVPPGACEGGRVDQVKVICFRPDPDTTQGEARAAAKLAEQYGWKSMVLVTTKDQVWRAHLRFARCYSGQLYGVA